MLDLHTFSGTKPRVLIPKWYDDHPRHFNMEVHSPGTSTQMYILANINCSQLSIFLRSLNARNRETRRERHKIWKCGHESRSVWLKRHYCWQVVVATVLCMESAFQNNRFGFLFFLGKYFIAQSCTSSTDDSSSASNTPTRRILVDQTKKAWKGLLVFSFFFIWKQCFD